MRSFQDTFEKHKRSFICAFSIWMTVQENYARKIIILEKNTCFNFDIMYFHFLSFTSALKYILLFCIQSKNQSNVKLYPAEVLD